MKELWNKNELLVVIRSIHDIAKFSNLRRTLIKLGFQDIKPTFDVKTITAKLRKNDGSHTGYIGRYGVYQAMIFANIQNTIEIEDFIKLFKFDLIINDIENLLKNVEEKQKNNNIHKR